MGIIRSLCSMAANVIEPDWAFTISLWLTMDLIRAAHPTKSLRSDPQVRFVVRFTPNELASSIVL